jgi:preprotein translocase subunit Sss1
MQKTGEIGINRFSDYTLNLDRKPPQPEYIYTLKSTALGS